MTDDQSLFRRAVSLAKHRQHWRSKLNIGGTERDSAEVSQRRARHAEDQIVELAREAEQRCQSEARAPSLIAALDQALDALVLARTGLPLEGSLWRRAKEAEEDCRAAIAQARKGQQ